MFKFTLLVQAKSPASLVVYNGFLVRTAIMNLLKNHDPWRLNRIMKKYPFQPLTVSKLISLRPSKSRARHHELFFQERGLGKFQVNIFSQELLALFLEALNSFPIELTIGEYQFMILRATYHKLNLDLLLQRSFQGNHARLSFLAPTFFKQTGRRFPLYYPFFPQLFRSLMTHWNAFYSIHVPSTILGEFTPFLRLESYSLRLVKAPFFDSVVQGFLGTVQFTWEKNSVTQWIPVLLSYSEYANIGSKRIHGFGEVMVTYY